MTITIYHNPQCSKSRAAYALIASELAGEEPVILVEYLKSPPTLDELKQLRILLGVPVREMLRDAEAVYRKLGLSDESLSDENSYWRQLRLIRFCFSVQLLCVENVQS